MKTGELAAALRRLAEDDFCEDTPAVAIAADGTTYRITGVDEEVDEDARSSTVWLRIEEN